MLTAAGVKRAKYLNLKKLNIMPAFAGPWDKGYSKLVPPNKLAILEKWPDYSVISTGDPSWLQYRGDLITQVK